ncbi:MAG: YkgJ family cysteine cluster protein, partial [Bacteroidetes bacterium]|nr:YkgJ family cysteine cluster protein [Bacteroidota bacterium]
GQDVALHNQHNDKLMELISLKNKILPGKLEGAHSDQFYLALYDLDEFRTRISDHDLLNKFDLPPTLLQTLKTDDEALMDFGIAWVKYMLFGIDLDIKG